LGKAKTKWNEIPLSNELNTLNLKIKINDKIKMTYWWNSNKCWKSTCYFFCKMNLENFNIEKIGPKLKIMKCFQKDVT
jgi:diaminopimelate epimerase